MLRSWRSLAGLEPEAPAVIESATGAAISRRALQLEAESLRAELHAAGIREGDVVAAQLPNGSRFIAAFLAALQDNLVFLPIDRDAAPAEVSSVTHTFGARALIHQTGVIVHRTESLSLPATTRLLKLTSGSTGRPRGVVTSDQNLTADARNICSTMGIIPGDINLGAIPFSHSYGFSNLVTPLLMQGTAVVAPNDDMPQSLLDTANRYRCTVAPLIPMVMAHLISTAHGSFESVRTFISAGAPLPPLTSRLFRECFEIDIHSFYGCSECGGISYDRSGGAAERETVGTPMNGVAIEVDEGRLSVRSESVALGYHDGERFEPIGASFLTDDLVELRDGEIALTGRASDQINVAGKKVNPREVESVLLEIEGVREAKVYGEPAGARGEVVAAAIVASLPLDREAIREHCRQRLSSHKVPRIVKLIDQMPVDERGKIKISSLRT